MLPAERVRHSGAWTLEVSSDDEFVGRFTFAVVPAVVERPAPPNTEAPKAVAVPLRENQPQKPVEQPVIVSGEPVEQPKVAVKAAPSNSGEPSARQEGPQLGEKADAKPKAGAMFNEGEVLHPKIANVKILSRPSDNGETVTTLSKDEQIVYMGQERDGYLRVEAANGKGWVKKVLVTR